MTRLSPAAAALLLAACAPAAPPASPTPQPMADLDALARTVDSLRVAARIPGLSVAVVRGGEVVLARGFGLADAARGIPATAETPYNVASVAKPLSAVVALRLVEEGALDLDRPMTEFAGFAEFCAAVRAEPGLFFRDYRCEGREMTLRHVLSMRVNGPPGERFSYNPQSYSWASRPMAEVAGAPFSSLVDRHVFAPAGMARSARIHRRLPLRADLAADLAPPHRVDGDGRAVRADDPPPQGDGAAGGVISTVTDLARFDVALDAGRLVSPAHVREMMTPHRAPDGTALPYGLGWYVQPWRGETLVWHAGLWEGAYSALYLKVPARGVTLLLLANSDGLAWGNGLQEAAVERSPFARAFLDAFVKP
jgi:CubicO group peptidase (beta-lactamase class C family)